ncbi:MAG: metallophosphoesterase [Myxococcales bacterium]|nr:metallophosphoesterase [Myxococcales bacterium]
MRIGIFSDTHSNIEALSAVMGKLREEKLDQLVCLGDTVGYGANPNECCDIVREVAAFTILGNHDAAVAGRMDYSYYYDAARNALDLHASMLTAPNMAWLKTLPYERRQEHMGFCHGSPVNLEEFEYIFAPEQAARCLPDFDKLADVTFIGHSHLCKAFALDRDEVHEVVATRFEVRKGMRYVISVGSVGQPRDYDPRASYVTYDSTTRIFEFKRVAYDVESAARKIFDSKLERNFGNRLFIGV